MALWSAMDRTQQQGHNGCYSPMTHPAALSPCKHRHTKVFQTFPAPSQLFLPLGIPASQFSSHNSMWSSMAKHDLINMKYIPAAKQKKLKRGACAWTGCVQIGYSAAFQTAVLAQAKHGCGASLTATRGRGGGGNVNHQSCLILMCCETAAWLVHCPKLFLNENWHLFTRSMFTIIHGLY